jgi:hypothetical protein
MRSAVLRTSAAFVIIFIAIALRPSQSSSQYTESSSERVWLAVEEHARGQLTIEPIATVDDGDLAPIQTSCMSYGETTEDFSAKYLRPGKKYAMLFGGAPIGEGAIGEQNRSAATASFTYAGPTKIRGQIRALATNADQSDFRVASREPATAEQRTEALALARDLFSQNGIPEALLPKVRAEFLTRTFLAPSTQPSLIGSFTLDTGDTEALTHHMFFIASHPGEKLQSELLWLHIAETETDEELLRLVDHADLFSNGRDEVIAKLIAVATESHRYLIFRRTKDGAHWEQFFKTESLGCSS